MKKKINKSYEYGINIKKTYRKILIVITTFFSVILLIYGYLLFAIEVPSDIKIILNEEDEFTSSIPITACFDNKCIGVISVDNKLINKNGKDVNIEKDFSIKASKIGKYKADVKAFGLITIKKLNVEVVENRKLIVGGVPIGIYVETDGLLVLGTGEITGSDKQIYSPAKNILKSGDYIIGINGKKVNDKNIFTECIQRAKDDDINLKIRRNKQIMNVAVKRIRCNDNSYKIGTWIRNNMQGIGTLTYYDEENNSYGGLGHGINDVDTSKLMEINTGKIYNSEIIDIIKGKVKSPGELVGIIDHNKENELGILQFNSSKGIYGKINNVGKMKIKEKISKDTYNDVYEVGLSKDIKTGNATLRTMLNDRVEEYKIKITKINKNNNSNKNFMIRIIDKKLLNLTNGIVQGMSGSPIIQNGKLVGAVTHVFVNDPTRGYGIFIENMLDNDDF